jgi:hypothetical protein
MAALTFFLATSPTKKHLSRDDVESLIVELLHEGHVKLPAAIFVGEALNEPRGEQFDLAAKEKTLPQASQFIIPNAPENMLNIARNMAERKKGSADTLWWFGEDETAFLEAFRSVPYREKDLCVCFPFLSDYLYDECGWNGGAVIYILTRPFFIDFMDVFDTTARPLIDYQVFDFFTLSSLCGGSFSDTVQHPLKSILEQVFGKDLDMQQT